MSDDSSPYVDMVSLELVTAIVSIVRLDRNLGSASDQLNALDEESIAIVNGENARRIGSCEPGIDKDSGAPRQSRVHAVANDGHRVDTLQRRLCVF